MSRAADTHRRIHLGVLYPGTNSTAVWSDPSWSGYADFSSFAHLARTAERAKFDFFFLAESLRLREQHGKIYERDVAGRPDNFTMLAALAAVTERIGLVGTINSTFNEPFEVARQFATLDHLTGGRAGWNVVTSWERFIGENFRRGSFLAKEQRYERAELFLDAALKLLRSWAPHEVVADQAGGNFLRTARAGLFEHRDTQFDIAGRFNVPRSPQGAPVIFQAGGSDKGMEFAAARADAVFGMYSDTEQKKRFYADLKGRLPRYGRARNSLLVLPASTFALGETEAEAQGRAREVRRSQVDATSAIRYLEELWNRDLSGYDPEGPLPEVEPLLDADGVASRLSSVRHYPDRMATAAQWREVAEAKKLSIRDLVIEVTGWQTFIGTPSSVAVQMAALVEAEACDGFVIVPHLVPGGLDEFADTVVPLLQERGLVREEYEGETLRDHLGLAPRDGSSESEAVR
jgi:FMN-dependent oxidoreductase (nitrilotriacetate monooxygenase family)